jgi:hypothetical protein
MMMLWIKTTRTRSAISFMRQIITKINALFVLGEALDVTRPTLSRRGHLG